MTHTPEHDAAPVALGLNYRALKFLAIGMGVILIGGLLLMFSFMAKQMSSTGGGKICDATTINISAGDELLKIEEADDRVTLWVKDTSGSIAIRRYSLCDGTVLRDLRLSGGRMPAPATPPAQ